MKNTWIVCGVLCSVLGSGMAAEDSAQSRMSEAISSVKAELIKQVDGVPRRKMMRGRFVAGAGVLAGLITALVSTVGSAKRRSLVKYIFQKNVPLADRRLVRKMRIALAVSLSLGGAGLCGGLWLGKSDITDVEKFRSVGEKKKLNPGKSSEELNRLLLKIMRSRLKGTISSLADEEVDGFKSALKEKENRLALAVSEDRLFDAAESRQKTGNERVEYALSNGARRGDLCEERIKLQLEIKNLEFMIKLVSPEGGAK